MVVGQFGLEDPQEERIGWWDFDWDWWIVMDL